MAVLVLTADDLTQELRMHLQGCCRMSVIAHSMGNRIVVSALEQVPTRLASSAQRAGAELLHASAIIFAAPDVSCQEFQQVMGVEGNGNLPAGVVPAEACQRTLYISYYDLALHLSRFWNGNARAGLALSLSGAYDSVDAARAGNWFKQPGGHAYFAQSAAVVRDIQLIVAKLPPVAAPRRLRSATNVHGTLQLCDGNRTCLCHMQNAGQHYLIIP